MKSRELFPDGQDTLQMGNQTVRKGTLGAFIQNALALDDSNLQSEKRAAIISDIEEQVAGIKATQALEVFSIRSLEVRELVDRELRRLACVSDADGHSE